MYAIRSYYEHGDTEFFRAGCSNRSVIYKLVITSYSIHYTKLYELSGYKLRTSNVMGTGAQVKGALSYLRKNNRKQLKKVGKGAIRAALALIVVV